jgi:hypothetical protein
MSHEEKEKRQAGQEILTSQKESGERKATAQEVIRNFPGKVGAPHAAGASGDVGDRQGPLRGVAAGLHGPGREMELNREAYIKNLEHDLQRERSMRRAIDAALLHSVEDKHAFAKEQVLATLAAINKLAEEDMAKGHPITGAHHRAIEYFRKAWESADPATDLRGLLQGKR